MFFFILVSAFVSVWLQCLPSFFKKCDQHPPPRNLQLLLAVVQREVQGEDEEDYTKKEGMIRSSTANRHTVIPKNFLFLSLIIELSLLS